MPTSGDSVLPNANIIFGDCIRGMAEHVPDEHVHLTVTSIPFEALFSYSGKIDDLANNPSEVNIRGGRFALNMRFVIEQLFRVHAPGTNCCIHIQTLLAYKNQHGWSGRRDFRGAVIDWFGAGGFKWTGEFVIQKDPQRAANTLNLISLQFKTGYARNACNLAPWINDYVLVFQKPGECRNPVRAIRHKTNPTGWMTTDEWVRDAHGVWTDILEIDVLDGAKSQKEDQTERHVCPLQLEVIRRLVRLYSNPVSIQPDATVLDPFMGIGSTAHVCLCGKTAGGVLEGPRNVIGFELKESYHRTALAKVERARKQLAERDTAADQTEEKSLFDALESA